MYVNMQAYFQLAMQNLKNISICIHYVFGEFYMRL